MPRKKPRPDTPTEIINKTIEPYDLLGIGNPNPTTNHNRAEDVSVRDDTNADFKIGLEDLYNAIKYYIDNKVKPHVIENGQLIPVPVEYAFAERWETAQKEGFLRDREGRVLLPIIAIKRDTIVRNRALGNKLDGNKVHNYQKFETLYSKKNIYDNFGVVTNRIPVKEARLSPVPDYIIVTYNCSIYCNYQEDVDKIIQAFAFVADSYWGEYQRFKFKINIEQFTDSIEYSQGEDRSVRTDFNITLNGYLLADTVARDMATQKKILSKAQIIFKAEMVTSDPNIVTPISSLTRQAPVIVVDNINHSNNSGNLTPDVIKYINTNKQLDSVSVTSNTATFSGAFLVAPLGFPSTSLDNFSFFANGVYIDKTAIVSFTDLGTGSCLLQINAAILGYSFAPDYVITAVGKFS